MSYCTLEVAAGYLKNIDALAADPTKGITQADLDRAEADAQALIDSQLAPRYDVTGWATDTPPVIELVAEMLAGAQVLRYRYQRDSLGASGAGEFAEVLQGEARKLLVDLEVGRLNVVLSDGSIQRMRAGVGSTVPRARNPEE